jgi:uncharacterized protein (DUF169 family)
MTDLKKISEILVKKAKVRGNPVAISLFQDKVPDGYEPIQDTPCSIVRYAMDEGRKVYFDAEHHDCLVGVHHAGIVPGKQEIVAGEYLSKTSTFFTYEGAARLKAGTLILPPGMVQAIGAAPLDKVPEGVKVDWIVAVCNPHNANSIGGCRLCKEGIPPYASFGTSLCGELFAVPWHIKNVMVVGGDFGGRMHNRIKQDQLFVIIPIEFVDYLPSILTNMRVDVKATREMTKPAHSLFWQKKDPDTITETQEAGPQESSEITFSMPWDDEAKELLKKVPEGILEMVVGNSEEFAREKGYDQVTKKSMDEQMESLGMNLDDMLD